MSIITVITKIKCQVDITYPSIERFDNSNFECRIDFSCNFLKFIYDICYSKLDNRVRAFEFLSIRTDE